MLKVPASLADPKPIRCASQAGMRPMAAPPLGVERPRSLELQIAQIRSCMHIYVYVYVHIYIYIYMYICMYFLFAFYVSIDKFINIYTSIYIHTHIMPQSTIGAICILGALGASVVIASRQEHLR